MNDTQKQILADALRAETEPAVVTAVGNRDDVGLANWCNAPTTTDAWNPAMADQAIVRGDQHHQVGCTVGR